MAPEQILKWGGGTDPARSAIKKLFRSCPSSFLALEVQLVVLVSAFMMVSTVWWFLVGCSTHGVPRAQPFVKVGGGHVPPVPYGVGATAFCLGIMALYKFRIIIIIIIIIFIF